MAQLSYSVECRRAQVPQSKQNENELNFISCKIRLSLLGKCKQCLWVCYRKWVVDSPSISIFHLLSFIHIYSKLSILKNQHANTHSNYAHAVWVNIFLLIFFYPEIWNEKQMVTFLWFKGKKTCLLIRSKLCPVLSEYFAHRPEGPRFLLLMILE